MKKPFCNTLLTALILCCAVLCCAVLCCAHAAVSQVLVLPEGTKVIEAEAFYGDTSIREVVLPEGVETIGERAFANSGVTKVNLPESVEYIAPDAFDGCDGVTVIVVAGTAGEEYAKAANVKYEYVRQETPAEDFTYTIENGECTITRYTGDDADVVIPEMIEGGKVTGIGDKAFYKCESLTSISIPNGVTSIGNSAFYYCKSLTSISIPDSVTSIGDSAFFDCICLTSISIPDSVTSIGGWAFFDCTSLASISIPDSVTSIGYSAFTNCTSLTSISIPDSVTSIGNRAFSYCTSLTSISIPDGVTSIGYSAFSYCESLTSISIPDSVSSIGDWAFDDCPNLTIYGIAGSRAETYAEENAIPFKISILDPTEDSLPAEYYEIVNTYSYSGSTYFEANLIKNYNGITAPDPNYSSTFFFLDSKGRVVTDPTLLCKLYTIYMYVHKETAINNSISGLNNNAKIWSASALDFMSKNAIWSHAGGLAGELVKTYATGGLNFVGVLTTIGKNIWSNVKEANELGSWLEIVFVQKLLGHLDQLATIAGSMPVKNGYGAYDFDSVQAKLAVYAHFKNTYKAVNSICIPVNDEIIEKFKSDTEVSMYYVANALMEAVDSVAEDIPFASVSLTMFRQIINGDQDELDVASNVIGLIDEFAGIDLSDCGDLYDQLGNIGDVFDTVLGISQATALKDEAWLEPFYMTVDELKTTQLYKNHLLLAQ